VASTIASSEDDTASWGSVCDAFEICTVVASGTASTGLLRVDRLLLPSMPLSPIDRLGSGAFDSVKDRIEPLSASPCSLDLKISECRDSNEASVRDLSGCGGSVTGTGRGGRVASLK